MQRFPVVIVGGGIIGVMIAYELTRHDPNMPVLIVDQSLAGQGASRFSAGVHFPRGASDTVRRFSQYSHTYYRDLLQRHPQAPIHPLGMTVVCKASRQSAVEAQYLPLADLREVSSSLWPTAALDLPGEHLALTGEGANHADVQGLVRYLLKAMGDRVQVIEGARVESLGGSGAHVLELSTGHAIHADKLVLAPGPWTAARPWQSSLAHLGIRVKKVVAAHVRMPVSAEDGLIVFQDDDAFLLPLQQRGHWLFSYTCDEWDVDPGTVAPSLSFTDINDARNVLARYAPAWAERLDGGRVFCDAYSPDRVPIIAEVGRHLVFAGAANGSGYRLAPALAAEVLSLL
ncbi:MULTISPECIES: NAD(P)/FAD-dependent oxidoreductase [unclassified Pseudomonas]|uniref:NAD(P)/FAD-dependent oxidoreductase n=1 Tax=unclassified Pseudomonas TaxID=196821 RepID=UPI0019060F0C|nr:MULTISPECIES: FAD-dependent oxidoreductase [unclassified Pseudomonas]